MADEDRKDRSSGDSSQVGSEGGSIAQGGPEAGLPGGISGAAVAGSAGTDRLPGGSARCDPIRSGPIRSDAEDDDGDD